MLPRLSVVVALVLLLVGLAHHQTVVAGASAAPPRAKRNRGEKLLSLHGYDSLDDIPVRVEVGSILRTPEQNHEQDTCPGGLLAWLGVDDSTYRGHSTRHVQPACVPEGAVELPGRIPKRVVQTWKTHRPRGRLWKFMAHLHALNPDFEFLLFDDHEIDLFVAAHFPNLQFMWAHLRGPFRVQRCVKHVEKATRHEQKLGMAQMNSPCLLSPPFFFFLLAFFSCLLLLLLPFPFRLPPPHPPPPPPPPPSSSSSSFCAQV